MSEQKAPAAQAEPVAPGQRLIQVNATFDALMNALERADRKGYMPDAIAEEWEAFDYVHVTVPASQAVPLAAPPAAQDGDDPDIADIVAGALGTSRANAYELMSAALAARGQAGDEREAFEAWLGREAFTERSDSGKYVSAHIDAMWSAWQARGKA